MVAHKSVFSQVVRSARASRSHFGSSCLCQKRVCDGPCFHVRRSVTSSCRTQHVRLLLCLLLRLFPRLFLRVCISPLRGRGLASQTAILPPLARDDVDEWTHGRSHVARYRPEHDVKLLTCGSFLVVSFHAE